MAKYKYSYGGVLIGKKEVAAINKVVQKNYWPLASEGEKMEQEAAKFLGVKHGILSNSGSSAGLLALSALELPKGSEVIIPAVTFPTIFNIILQCGLTPVVVDSKIGTYNLDPNEIEAAISEKTKAIICVHAVGNPVDMPRVMEVARKHNLRVLEDNCLAEGTLIKTSKGDIPIQDIKIGDDVLTRKGYRRVLKTVYRGKKEVITKMGITATPDHPFIHKKGVKSLDGLNPSDILYTWNEKLFCIEEKSIIDILNQNIDTKESIIGLEQKLGSWLSIVRNGLILLGKFLKECLFTIKTEIHLIMMLPISNLLHPSYTVNTTLEITDEMLLPGKIFPVQEKRLSYGIHLQRVVYGIVNRVYKDGQKERKKVYDLEIEGEHEFFANNILVHNCDGWGGTINGKAVGSFGDISFTSFHAAHIVAMGQGGGVFTNDEELARRVRMYRDWGRQSDIPRRINGDKWPTLPEDYDSRFIYEKIGYNLSPLELQAAMGRVQLKKIGKIKKLRARNFAYLYENLSKFDDLIMPRWIEGAEPSWFAFPLSTKSKRGPLVAYLEKNGIETRSMFSGNILRHPAFANVEHRSMITNGSDCNFILTNSFWLGCHPRYGKKELDWVVSVFKKYYDRAS